MPTYEQLSSPRVLKGAPATIWLATYQDGAPTAPTSAGTVTVTNHDGATIASGAATIANDRLEYTLTAAQAANANILTASWATVVISGAPAVTLISQHEIVGDLLFTLREARALGGELGKATLYPNETIWQARDAIHDEFESILGYPLGGRVKREILSGDGSLELWLGEPVTPTIRSVEERTASTVTWTAYTVAELADVFATTHGRISRESLGYFPVGNRNLRVTYEAGDVPIRRELKRAALIVLQEQLSKSDIPLRASSQTNEMGTFTLSTPGLRGAEFGIPSVDVILNRLKRHTPGFA